MPDSPGESAPVLTIRLFGKFEARLNGEPLRLRRRHVDQLLAYLTLHHGKDVEYRILAPLICPNDVTQNDAEQNAGLRRGRWKGTKQSVFELRQALGKEAERLGGKGDGFACLNLEGADADVIAFDRLIERNDLASWKKAIALYCGPLLEGLEYKWAEKARLGYAKRFEQVVEKVVRHLTALGNTRGAEECLEEVSGLLEERTRKRLRELLGEPERPALREPDWGAVPPDSRYYIPRSADDEFRKAIASGGGIVRIKGARKMGKTSLLARGLQRAREDGAKDAYTDLEGGLGEASFQSCETFLRALGQDIAMQLDLDPPVWDPRSGPTMNLTNFLRRKVLGAFAEPLVWGLDGVDRLLPCDYRGEVLSLFRFWHNQRATDRNTWSRLTLVIAHVTEHHLFIRDLERSPFNVGTPVELEDFGLFQVEELNRRHEEPLRSEAEVREFYALLGGQPYLVRHGLNEMARRPGGLDLAGLMAQADRDDGPFRDELRELLKLVSRDSELTEAVRGVLHEEKPPTPESFSRLRSGGVLVGDSPEQARFRCRLYKMYLSRHLQ